LPIFLQHVFHGIVILPPSGDLRSRPRSGIAAASQALLRRGSIRINLANIALSMDLIAREDHHAVARCTARS
jgi:hypothetical protein